MNLFSLSWKDALRSGKKISAPEMRGVIILASILTLATLSVTLLGFDAFLFYLVRFSPMNIPAPSQAKTLRAGDINEVLHILDRRAQESKAVRDRVSSPR